MKMFLYIILASLIYSCTDPIDIDLENGKSQFVVDAIITNQDEEQIISLSMSTPYFGSSAPIPVSDALVKMTDSKGNIYNFEEIEEGKYKMQSSSTFFEAGTAFELSVINGDEEYIAKSRTNRVPEIDSMTWEKIDFGNPSSDKDSIWIAQFYARDFEGFGDTYWVRSTLNGKMSNGNTDLGQVAFDAFISQGSSVDGVAFIPPIRYSITPPFESNEVELFLEVGDEVGVLLYSVTEGFANFLTILQSQLNNGGLFAKPSTNMPTNVINKNKNGEEAIGWFEVSLVSEDTCIISKDKSNNKQ